MTGKPSIRCEFYFKLSTAQCKFRVDTLFSYGRRKITNSAAFFATKFAVSSVTEACDTTSFQKNRPKIRSNLTWQIEHALAKVPVKNQFRRRSKPPAETTEREHGV